MSLIIPANTLASGGYEVANSLRFNSGSSDSLNRTPDSGNRKTWTFSFWIKRTKLGVTQYLLSANDASANYSTFRFNGDQIEHYEYYSSAVQYSLKTNRLFRDVSSNYHILLAYNTLQGTAANRIKLYVNGVQETSFATSSYPSQNYDSFFNSGSYVNYIGTEGGSNNADGYMSEVCFIDGSALAPTDFGEFDEDSGIWKPIDVSGLTFGTNGFYLETKQSGTSQNSSGLGADTSGNDNHFAVNNLTAVDQSTDTCTNNFATLNPLDNYYYGSTFADGNLKQICNSSNYSYNTSTFGVSQGKWYVEIKNSSSGTIRNEIGIIDRVSSGSTVQIYGGVNGYGWFTNGNVNNNSSVIATYSTWTAGDIMGIALDLTNNKIYFAKNGTWQNSANPSNGTNGISITDPTSTLNGVYFIATGDYGGSDNSVNELNFGSPSFAISSGNTDGNGYGNFEYAVPTNYYSLNTKNLAEYG